VAGSRAEEIGEGGGAGGWLGASSGRAHERRGATLKQKQKRKLSTALTTARKKKLTRLHHHPVHLLVKLRQAVDEVALRYGTAVQRCGTVVRYSGAAQRCRRRRSAEVVQGRGREASPVSPPGCSLPSCATACASMRAQRATCDAWRQILRKNLAPCAQQIACRASKPWQRKGPSQGSAGGGGGRGGMQAAAAAGAWAGSRAAAHQPGHVKLGWFFLRLSGLGGGGGRCCIGFQGRSHRAREHRSSGEKACRGLLLDRAACGPLPPPRAPSCRQHPTIVSLPSTPPISHSTHPALCPYWPPHPHPHPNPTHTHPYTPPSPPPPTTHRAAPTSGSISSSRPWRLAE
jgi:hypothetical protein